MSSSSRRSWLETCTVQKRDWTSREAPKITTRSFTERRGNYMFFSIIKYKYSPFVFKWLSHSPFSRLYENQGPTRESSIKFSGAYTRYRDRNTDCFMQNIRPDFCIFNAEIWSNFRVNCANEKLEVIQKYPLYCIKMVQC